MNISYNNNEKLIQYKEYYNVQDSNYYIKIGISINNNLIIRSYKLDVLNNVCYQISLDIDKIKRINKAFYSFESMNEIYILITKIFNYNKFKIEFYNEILLCKLFIPDMNEIQIKLEATNNYDLLEYNILLTKSINILKNDFEKFNMFMNNTKNKYQNSDIFNKDDNINILIQINKLKEEIKMINKNLSNVIEENNSNKKKISELKDIISVLLDSKNDDIIKDYKYKRNKDKNEDKENNNKINEFIFSKPKIEKSKEKKEEMITIQEFNKIFKVNIRNNDNITELKLGYKNLGMNKIKFLALIDFSNLEQLWLSNNNIVDISIFEKLNYKNLQKLDLSNNNISNISALENVNFNNLKNLWINNNIINDISVFSRVKFIKLIELNLKNNRIKSINVFEKNRFIYLQVLDLSLNKIEADVPKNKDICDNLKSKIRYFNI